MGRSAFINANAMNPLDDQIGGTHYKDYRIQPVEYIYANGLDFLSGNIIKYVTRWKSKNGVEDLKKARHYLDILIMLESRTGEEKQKGLSWKEIENETDEEIKR